MSASRAERRLVERKKEQGRIWGVFGAVALALLPFIVPRIPLAIGIALFVIWLASWRMARDGYKFRLSRKWAACVMLAHGGALALVGYLVWPGITVSPARISFAGYPNETFNFSVKNGRSDDIYDVQIPFLIGYGKHFEDKLSAKVVSNGDPPQRVYDDYNYCFGKSGDLHKVLPNEREVLIVRIRHLPPFGVGGFAITYTGGNRFDAVLSETPNFVSKPSSYSPNQFSVGVRGNYRICKYVVATDGMLGK